MFCVEPNQREVGSDVNTLLRLDFVIQVYGKFFCVDTLTKLDA